MKVKLFMKKVITIIGIIIIIIGISSMVLVSRDILAFGGFKTSQSTQINSSPTNKLGTTVYEAQDTVLDQSVTKSIPSIYASIRTYFRITSSVDNQYFNISLGIIIYQQNSYCATGQLCFLPVHKDGFTITNQGTNKQDSLLTTEHTLPTIPIILSSGLQISSNTQREYVIRITSDHSFTFIDQTFVKSRVIYPIATLFTIIGIIVTITGVVLKPANGGSKKLRKRSWQEPTLGGTASLRNSRGSIRSSTSSKGGIGNSSSPKVSSAVSCKKCGGVMPRNSQYCPHCYSKQ